MSDGRKLIVDVVAMHRMGTAMTFYRDGSCKVPTCRCGESMHPNAYPEHLAAEIDKALGGLTKVWSEVVVMDDGYTYPQWNQWYDEQQHAQKAVYDNPGTVLGEAFVSGWTVTK